MRHSPMIAILSEDRLVRSGGQLFGLNASAAPHWQRYAEIFGELKIVARVEQRAQPTGAAALAIDPWIEIWEIPSFQGPRVLLPKLRAVLRELRKTAQAADGFIVRWPGTLTMLALPFLLASRKPIAVEVVGDPLAVFRSGVGGPAAGILARISEAAGSRLFAAASAVTYVTDGYLQSRYPAGPHAITAASSDVILLEAELRVRPRIVRDLSHRPSRLLFAGTMEQRYKGIDTLLGAVAILNGRGPGISLRMAGAGRLEGSLRDEIARLGLEDRVALLGHIGKAEMRDEMDECDLFVLPSRTEGLPRTIIEAMARATPVVASAVGGISELLPADCLVAPDDPQGLAGKLALVLANPERLAAMSERNLQAARRFTTKETEPIRKSFYLAFRGLCEAKQQGGRCHATAQAEIA